jgi:hypothetical protein
MKENDCHTCKHRRAVPGSAHSECHFYEHPGVRFLIAQKMSEGNPIQITSNSTGEQLIEFNEVGIRKGWCMWPVNFDPVWVTCRLPIE